MKKGTKELQRKSVALLWIIHQRGVFVFGCLSQGPGPAANGTTLQLEVTGRKVSTPINLVSRELSITAWQKGGGTHCLAVIGMMGESGSAVMRSTLTRALISDQTSAADRGAGE